MSSHTAPRVTLPLHARTARHLLGATVGPTARGSRIVRSSQKAIARGTRADASMSAATTSAIGSSQRHRAIGTMRGRRLGKVRCPSTAPSNRMMNASPTASDATRASRYAGKLPPGPKSTCRMRIASSPASANIGHPGACASRRLNRACPGPMKVPASCRSNARPHSGQRGSEIRSRSKSQSMQRIVAQGTTRVSHAFSG